MTTLHLVSHTHWDREWYLTREQFRLKLVRVIDDLLAILAREPDFHSYLVDGQTILLEDYLALRPEQAPEIKRYVRQGRLLTGPWHVMPDEFLASPEALIRNLLQGERSARALGGVMPVGYTPDPFGHIGQMPQILRGFGLESAALMRGLGDEPCELWWQAPDGSRVLTAYLRDGYDNAAQLPVTLPGPFATEVTRLAGALRPHAASSHLLLMHGSDHSGPAPATPQAIQAAAAALAPDRLIHSSLPAYLEAVRREASVRRLPLPVVQGELRSSRRHPLLPNVLSTRIWIKQRNHACQTLLERWAEPFCTWAEELYGDQPRLPGHLTHTAPILRNAWARLIENHFHDSICGTGSDAVHEEMRLRFDQVEQVGEELARQALDALAARVATSAGAPQDAAAAVVVFNASPFPQGGLVDAALRLPAGFDGFDLLDDQGRTLPYELEGVDGHELANITLDRDGVTDALGMIHEGRLFGLSLIEVGFRRREEELLIDLILDEYRPPDLTLVAAGLEQIRAYLADPTLTQFTVRARELPMLRLRFPANEVPAFGRRTFWLRPDGAGADAAAAEGSGARIENEFFEVDASPADGTLRLVDKRNGIIFNGLNRFVDSGDRGDEYNTCPLPGDRPSKVRVAGVRVARGALEQALHIDLVLSIPAGLAVDRQARSAELVEVPVRVRAALTPGVARLDVHVSVENRARDHRLRVHFPTPFKVDAVDYDGHFQVVRRPIDLPPAGEGWAEAPRPEVPQRLYSDICDGRAGLLLANRGLPEMEARRAPDGTVELALTLLRCVGWLSRADLETRPGHAGPPLATPGAQMIGTWECDYALIPHSGEAHPALAEAYAFDLPLRAAATDLHAGDLAPSGAFLRVTPPDFIITAVKPAEDGRGLIVRGYNPGAQSLRVSLTPARRPGRAWRVRLDEARPRPFEIRPDGSLNFTARPYEIVTLRLD